MMPPGYQPKILYVYELYNAFIFNLYRKYFIARIINKVIV